MSKRVVFFAMAVAARLMADFRLSHQRTYSDRRPGTEPQLDGRQAT